MTLPLASGELQIHARVADRFPARLIGLIGQRTPPSAATGLVLRPGGAVHTFGMRYPIDILQLDRNLLILTVARRIPPKRIVPAPRWTALSLELAGGVTPPGVTGCRFHCKEAVS
jgi:uncharacterized membrane protein (UPF0127 family)